MFQALFGGGFNPNKTKTQLRLCVSRIKLLQNKKALVIRQQKKDIAQLLANGKEDSARIRVEALIQEQSCSIAYEILELYCELLSVRVELMKMNKSLPEDMKESVASVIYAAQRCSAQLPELKQVKDQLLAKYGKEYVLRCQNDETCVYEHVNPRIVDSLAIKVPSPKQKLALLSEIALEHNVDWEVITVDQDPLPETSLSADAGTNTTATGTATPLEDGKATPTYPSANTGAAAAMSGPYPTIEFSEEPDSPAGGEDLTQGIAVGIPLHPGDELSPKGGKGDLAGDAGAGAGAGEEASAPTAPVLTSTVQKCEPDEAHSAVPDLPDTPSPLNSNVKPAAGGGLEHGSSQDKGNQDGMDDLSKRLEALKTGSQLPKPPNDMS